MCCAISGKPFCCNTSENAWNHDESFLLVAVSSFIWTRASSSVSGVRFMMLGVNHVWTHYSTLTYIFGFTPSQKTFQRSGPLRWNISAPLFPSFWWETRRTCAMMTTHAESWPRWSRCRHYFASCCLYSRTKKWTQELFTFFFFNKYKVKNLLH